MKRAPLAREQTCPSCRLMLSYSRVLPDRKAIPDPPDPCHRDPGNCPVLLHGRDRFTTCAETGRGHGYTNLDPDCHRTSAYPDGHRYPELDFHLHLHARRLSDEYSDQHPVAHTDPLLHADFDAIAYTDGHAHTDIHPLSYTHADLHLDLVQHTDPQRHTPSSGNHHLSRSSTDSV